MDHPATLTSSVAAPAVSSGQPAARPPPDVARVRIPGFSARVVGAVVAVLLVAYAAMALTASRTKGVSFDEGLQLAVGYNIWLNDDFRIEGANGDLVKRWATLPYLVTRPQFVTHDDPSWKLSLPYDLGMRFLFELGNSPESLLLQARAMVTLLGVAAGLLVFLASRDLFGAGPGLLSLALFVFSPAMLAFGGVVSTDMSITLTLFASTCCIWRLLHEVTWPGVLASLLATALLVLAKPTALVILPTAAVMIAVRLVAARPLHVRAGARAWTIERRAGQSGVIGVLVLLHVFAGWVAIWAHYGFRYAASPNPADPALRFFQPWTRDEIASPLVALLAWIRQTHFLPQGFRIGIDALLGCDDRLGAFMNGQWKIDGWRTFFPYAIWVKTPLVLFALLTLGAVTWWWLRRRRVGRHPAGGNRTPAPTFYGATPHLVLVGCYLAVAIGENINIGHRHVLPIYPPLYVLAGAAGLAWARFRWGRPAIGAAVCWLVVDSIMIRPHYLAYFGPQVGGPANGYKCLVDSSLDWGMDLPALKTWVERRDPQRRQRLYLSYFGTDKPEHYGIEAMRLPAFRELLAFDVFPLRSGHYAISASMLQGVYTAAFGPWNQHYEQLYRKVRPDAVRFEREIANPAARERAVHRDGFRERCRNYEVYRNLRFARLCAWLRHWGGPPEQVGYSILIWRLDRAALDAALLGPPAELVEGKGLLRDYRRI